MAELHPTFHDYRIDDENIEKFGGDPPSIALTLGFIEAAEFALEIGAGAIEERSMALAGRAKDLLVETPGVTLLSPTARAGSSGLVSFAVEGVEPEVIVDRLWDEDSVVLRTVRNPDGVRFSFAWFNTEDEVDRVLEAIRKIGTG
jgi:cysteine desulfurase/selenocysteine lyase